MIRQLEGNLVGQGLAASAGTLLLLVLVLMAMWALPAPSLDEDELDAEESSLPALPELPESEPIETYAVIAQRPVFNESRMPILEPEFDGEAVDEVEEEEVEAPDVTLAGVVITPEARMVTLREKESGESLIAYEGQPLEGSYGSWHVSRIEAREITLSSGDGEEVELQLEVHNATMKAPDLPAADVPPDEPALAEAEELAAAEEGEPVSRAEEIRQRIAERREELRRAAEENDQQAPTRREDYRSAIQNLMKGRQNQDNDENQR